MPVADQWALVIFDKIVQSDFWSLGRALWPQHGEHRIVTVRLLALADFSVFGGDSYVLFAASFLCITAQCILIGALAFKATSQTWLRATLLFVGAACLWSEVQNEALQWPFCSVNYITVLCTFASFVALANNRFWLGVTLAALALFSTGSGVLAWPRLHRPLETKATTMEGYNMDRARCSSNRRIFYRICAS